MGDLFQVIMAVQSMARRMTRVDKLLGCQKGPKPATRAELYFTCIRKRVSLMTLSVTP
jgi:hypothetical protein